MIAILTCDTSIFLSPHFFIHFIKQDAVEINGIFVAIITNKAVSAL